jgi:hypothetical protein
MTGVDILIGGTQGGLNNIDVLRVMWEQREKIEPLLPFCSL